MVLYNYSVSNLGGLIADEMTPAEVARKVNSFFRQFKRCTGDGHFELTKRFSDREYFGVEDAVSRYIRQSDEWFQPENLTVVRSKYDSQGAFNRELNRRLNNRAKLKLIIEEWRTFVHSFPGGYWGLSAIVDKYDDRRR